MSKEQEEKEIDTSSSVLVDAKVAPALEGLTEERYEEALVELMMLQDKSGNCFIEMSELLKIIELLRSQAGEARSDDGSQ